MKSRNIIFGAILSALVCFPLLLKAAPDPALPGFNTADGDHALFSVTTGIANSAFGWYALFADTDGSYNTGVGAGALDLNTSGTENTAVGVAALLLNTGSSNNAVGSTALEFNDDGSFNNAHGRLSLNANVGGFENNAFGDRALINNTASQNTAFGDDCLFSNTIGGGNTAVGNNAGDTIVDGSNNVCIGNNAGDGIVSANNQVAIGVGAAGPFADISNTCFIGSIYNQPVSDGGTFQDIGVDINNVIGFDPSTRRVKHDIQPMDNASETLYGLKPVTFKYNSDKTGRTQYGLIAEEVAEVAPDLVFRDSNGDVQTVQFKQVNMLLLNEFLKEHKKVQALEATVAQQQKGMEVLTAQLKEHAAQIQKVSAQLEVNKPAAKVVTNKP